MHLVNAYLWERQRFEPASHDERQQMVFLVEALQPAYASYGRLRRVAFFARYRSMYRISEDDARAHLHDLDTIESTVSQALSRPR